MKWARAACGGGAGGAAISAGDLGGGGGDGKPGCKWGHTCNAVRSQRLVYVFGGYGRDERQTNDVHVFDFVKEEWSKPLTCGTPPSPRDSHSCTTVGTKLFVFGGTDGANPLNDLYVLDAEAHAWSKPEVSGEIPAPREGHSAALVNDVLYIFGGCGKAADGADEVYFNDTYALNTATFAWKLVPTTGTAPLPRDSHSCSSFKNSLVVFGGEDAHNVYLSDVHVLDTDACIWKEMKTTGQKPPPRAGHAAVNHGRHLIVFGGFTDDRKLFNDLHVLDLTTGAWTRANPSPDGPSPRFSLAGDCVDSDRGVMLFYGGCNEELEALDDTYYLDTEMPRERDPSEPKLSMRKELKRRRQEYRIFPFSKRREAENDCLRLSHDDAQPAAQKMFEARVSDVFHYGYTLEASIHGKLFRGLLFSCKPGFAHAVQSYMASRRSQAAAAAAYHKY